MFPNIVHNKPCDVPQKRYSQNKYLGNPAKHT